MRIRDLGSGMAICSHTLSLEQNCPLKWINGALQADPSGPLGVTHRSWGLDQRQLTGDRVTPSSVLSSSLCLCCFFSLECPVLLSHWSPFALLSQLLPKARINLHCCFLVRVPRPVLPHHPVRSTYLVRLLTGP